MLGGRVTVKLHKQGKSKERIGAEVDLTRDGRSRRTGGLERQVDGNSSGSPSGAETLRTLFLSVTHIGVG